MVKSWLVGVVAHSGLYIQQSGRLTMKLWTTFYPSFDLHHPSSELALKGFISSSWWKTSPMVKFLSFLCNLQSTTTRDRSHTTLHLNMHMHVYRLTGVIHGQPMPFPLTHSSKVELSHSQTVLGDPYCNMHATICSIIIFCSLLLCGAERWDNDRALTLFHIHTIVRSYSLSEKGLDNSASFLLIKDQNPSLYYPCKPTS